MMTASSNRVVAWFSCGAASAVAAKTAIAKYGAVEVVYCDTSSSEHPDNPRFMADVAAWIGQPIKVIRSEKYANIDEVFEKRRYMSGIKGAICTVEMKKVPRFNYQEADDLNVFGFTADEEGRIADFARRNVLARNPPHQEATLRVRLSTGGDIRWITTPTSYASCSKLSSS